MHGEYFTGRYNFYNEMNHGRYAIVYRAHDNLNQKEVAIKVISKHVLKEKDLSDEYLYNERKIYRMLYSIDSSMRRCRNEALEEQEQCVCNRNRRRSSLTGDSKDVFDYKVNNNECGDFDLLDDNNNEKLKSVDVLDENNNEKMRTVDDNFQNNGNEDSCIKNVLDDKLSNNNKSQNEPQLEKRCHSRNEQNDIYLDLDSADSGRKHVITFYDIHKCSHNVEYIVMELIDGYDMKREVYERFNIKNRVQYTFKQRIDIMLQLIKGVEYLHSKNIYHGDLKPENIMITDERVVIVDFGCAVYNKRGRERACKFFMKGTPGFCPPEISDMEVLDREIDLEKVDVWALCCSFYYLFEGKLPFRDENFNDVRFNEVIIALNYDKECSEKVLRICERVFVYDPAYRLTLEEFKEEIINMGEV